MRIKAKTKVIEGATLADIDFESLIQKNEPVILKDVLSETPLVKSSQKSDKSAMDHLLSKYNDRPVLTYTVAPDAKGRFFYNQDITGINFKTDYLTLETFFDRLNDEIQAATGQSFYIGSAHVADHFPSLLEDDGLRLEGELFEKHPPRIGVWMGNRTTAATHFDVSNNVAACLVGHRRFTLFPPSQVENLYPGPLEPTPGGQVVSMFNLNDPDFDTYPRMKMALEKVQIAEISPGDILVYPALWWHQVEALDDFNVMVNYWWNSVPSYVDDPMTTLLHGLVSLRDRPDNEKQAWRHFFDYYIFGDANKAGNHLPEHSRGMLAPLDDAQARRLRSKILKKMNR